MPHSRITAIGKDQETDILVFCEEIEDVLQGDDTIFDPPVSCAMTMPCIIDTEQFVPTWIGFGFIGGVSNRLQYGLFVGYSVGRTDN